LIFGCLPQGCGSQAYKDVFTATEYQSLTVNKCEYAFTQ